MQVSDVNDKVTHASIGAKQTQAMGISSSAEFFHVLSSSLYSDQKLAPVREVICNADDAHKIIGCTKPIEITIGSSFVVRDFGPGIAKDMIIEIYGTYGNSTKKKQSEQTGGFGLGSKSPFAYVDSFEVTSHHQGVKTIYRINKSDAEANGEPSIVTVLSMPTTETGIEVSIKLRPGDMGIFTQNTCNVVMHGGIHANLDGKQLPIWHKPEDTNWALIKGQGGVQIRYGAVLYPVQDNEEYRHELQSAINAIRYVSEHKAGLVLFATADSISVAPSREQLSYSPLTVKTIKELLPPFSALVQGTVRQTIDKDHKERIIELIKRGEHMATLRAGYGSINAGIATVTVPLMSSSAEDLITAARGLGLNTLSHSYAVKRIWAEVFRTKKMHPAFHGIKNSTQLQDDFLKVSIRLLSSMHRNNMKMENLFIADLKGWNREIPATGYYYDHHKQFSNLNVNDYEYLDLAQGKLVLTHRKQGMLKDLAEYLGKTSSDDLLSFFGYRVPRDKAAMADAYAFAKRIGFEIIDLTVQQKLAEPVKKPAVSKPKDTRIFFKDTPDGMQYMSVVNAKKGSYFGTDYVYGKQDPLLIFKPRAVVLIKSNAKHSVSLPGLTSTETQEVVQLWGAYIAVVHNEKMYQQAISEGAKPLTEFVKEQLYKEIAASKTFYSESSTNISRIRKTRKTKKWFPKELLFNIAKHKLAGFSGSTPTVSPRDNLLWELVYASRHHLLASDDTIEKTAQTTPLDKRFVKLFTKLIDSPIFSLVNFVEIDELLSDNSTDEDINKANLVLKFVMKQTEKM